MQFNGFNFDAAGRVVFNDTDAFASTYLGIPATATGDAFVSQAGAVTSASNRGGKTSDGKLLYQDVAATPYAGVKFSNGTLSFTQAGALLCDSVGAIAYYIGGLPFTVSGALCIDESTPIPAFTLATETGDLLTTESGDYITT